VRFQFLTVASMKDLSISIRLHAKHHRRRSSSDRIVANQKLSEQEKLVPFQATSQTEWDKEMVRCLS
jgi:hypothetical protein